MNNNSNSRYIPIPIRKEVLFRQHYLCYGCKQMLPSTYQIDHITPFALCGKNDINNLQALCPNCHSYKTRNDNILIRKWKKENSMEIEEETPIYKCDCKPNFLWKNKKNYKKHFLTKRHKLFIEKQNMMEID